MANTNKLPLWQRWWGLLIGAVTLFWLPIEDVTITMLGLLSAGWGIWLGGWVFQRGWFQLNRRSDWQRNVTRGGLAGALLPAVAMLLTILKAGLHGHGFLDFSFSQLGWLLVRTPLWVGLGCLAEWITGSWFGEKSSK